MAISRTDMMVVGGAILVAVIGYNWGEGSKVSSAETAQMRDIKIRALIDCKSTIAAHIGADISDIPFAPDIDEGENAFLFMWERGTIMAPVKYRRNGTPISASCAGGLVPFTVDRVIVDQEEL